MEEKERFEWSKPNQDGIFDNDTGITWDVLELVREQETRIKELSKNFEKYREDAIKGYNCYEDEIFNLKCENIRLKQSQKNLAISELEKVKNKIESKVKNIDKRLDDLKIKIVCESISNQISTYQEIVEIINQQIKGLKGEK